jgi:hypothetical protein
VKAILLFFTYEVVTTSFVHVAFIYVGAHSVTITVTNNCAYTIWPADQTSAQQSQLSNTGFELASKASTSLGVPTP